MLLLDRLLAQLKQEGHRVLLYCQMTKMMDILEDYLRFRRYVQSHNRKKLMISDIGHYDWMVHRKCQSVMEW